MSDDGSDGEDHGEGHEHRDHGHGDGHEHEGHGHGDGHEHEGDGRDHGDSHDHGTHDHGHGDHGHDHDHHAHDLAELGVAVVTVSSSRSVDEDPAGDRIVAALEDSGNEVVTREIVADDYDGIQSRVDTLVARGDVDAVVTTGGTGVTPDDVTVEAVEPLLSKTLPGFGELFRRLSYDEIGTRVVGTRTIAGVTDGVVVFCLPGSENAARLGIEEVILPEVGHLAGLARRDDGE